MRVVYTAAGRQVELAAELGKGGEGTIYRIPSRPLECAKIYNKLLPPNDSRKLQVMVDSPPHDRKILGARTVSDSLGIDHPQVVAQGDLDRSMLYVRMIQSDRRY